MFTFKLLLVFLISLVTELRLLKCSLVIDNASQKSIVVSDYCPAFEHCREGAHVMCMHYNPNRVLGPKCSNAQNISITENLAMDLLDVVNAIRSKVANGKEVGKNGVRLPRGYGIFRLKWDNELATFAQVLANQCTLKRDLCRSTKRFPDPGQMISLVRFSYPDWHFLYQKTQNNPGLNEDKITYAVKVALRTWYTGKKSVTEQMVHVYPDFILLPNLKEIRYYMEMIYGGATHMGCGISAYSIYWYKNNTDQNLLNSILIVCNYSHRPLTGRQTYTTEPPVPGSGYSTRCGCPPGYSEDQDCLCNLEPKIPERKSSEKCNSLDGKGCEPTLVLLPIFTLEDAPPHKLIEQAENIKDPLKDFILQRIDGSSDAQRIGQSQNIFDVFTPKPKQSMLQNGFSVPLPSRSAVNYKSAPSPKVVYRVPLSQPEFPLAEDPPFAPPRIPPPPPPPPPLPPRSAARSRHQTRTLLPIPPSPPPRKPSHALTPTKPDYFTALRTRDDHQPAKVHSDELEPPKIGPPPIPPRKPKKRVTKKTSIFTKVAQFKLPGRKSMVSAYVPVKKDVPPRKDFSNLHKVLDDYIKRQRFTYRRDEVHPEEITTVLPTTHTDVHTDEKTTETILKTVEEKVINFNQYLKDKKSGIDNRTLDLVLKDDNDKDNKLLSLLNTLEKEVKHVALDGNEKELFDAKIRKIYGSIVGTTETTLLPISTNAYDSDIAEIDIGNSKNSGKHDIVNFTDNEKHPHETKISDAHHEEDVHMGIAKNYDYLVHSRNEKFNNDLGHKKYNNNLDNIGFSDMEGKHEVYDHNRNYKYDHKYESDVEHKYMDDYDNKYNENLDRNKYSENILDRKFDIKHKYNDNEPKYQYDEHLNHKYDENFPTHRNSLKYEGKDFDEFREYKHNSLTSLEDNAIRHNNLLKFRNRDLVKSSRDRFERDGLRSKDPERKYKDKAEIKRNKIHHYSDDDLNDPLSLERRKYYQEKIDNIERRLRSSSRNGRHKNDLRNNNNRQMRRMKTSVSRTRSKSDNIYIPQTARILHSF